jgi:putative nucleotidyltransferase with HDIG domain
MGFISSFREWRRRRERVRNNRARTGGKDVVAPKQSEGFSRTMTGVAAVLLVWLVCVANIIYRPPQRTDLLVRDQRVPVNVIAQVSFDYIDPAATGNQRELAANQVVDIFRIDPELDSRTRTNVQQFLALFDPEASNVEATGAVREAYESLTPAERKDLAEAFNSKDRCQFCVNTLRDFLTAGIISAKNSEAAGDIVVMDVSGIRKLKKAGHLKAPRQVADELVGELAGYFHTGFQSASLRQTASLSLSRLIEPNLIYDIERTQKERQLARQSIEPVRRGIHRGAILLEKGERVTDESLAMMKAHDEEAANSAGSDYLAIKLAAIALIIALVGLVYFRMEFAPQLAHNATAMLVALLVAVTICLNRMVQELFLNLASNPNAYIIPALPIALAAVTFTLLLGLRFGVTIGFFVALLSSLTAAEPLHVFMLGMVTSFAGAFAVCAARTRPQTFRVPIVIAVSALVVDSIYLVVLGTPWHAYLLVFAVALLSGLFITIVANLLLPLLEYLTGITTDITLLEMSDLNHPLLKQLQLEAPGTYHHTQMVATLAEHAAEAIGANTLKARVCSYFHDIGKLSNPSYFTENSFGVDRHQHLRPRMSALIIINHVKEGLAMAARHKLRKPIREAIATHHGTSCVSFFLHRAQVEAEKTGDTVNPEDYRYPGPLPRSKEATIISLCDACEAASRSLEKPTHSKIENLVSEIFRNRLLDGQLAESELTMTEINTVQATIKKTLLTMLHGRIAYPKTISEHGSLVFEPPPAGDPNAPSAGTDSDSGTDSQAGGVAAS